jgi:hypothetical protein
MFTYRNRRAFLAFSLPRAAIEHSKWGWLLIAMIAIIAVDTLLAAGAWFAVGYIMGK